MTGQSDWREPVLPREDAPDHEPQFWNDLDASMRDATTELDVTQQLPVESTPIAAGSRFTPDRRHWPMLAAAALLAVVAVAALVVRANDSGTQVSTDFASADSGDPALEGPATEGAGGDEGQGATAGGNDGVESSTAQPPAADTDDAPETIASPTVQPPVFEPASGVFPAVQYPPLDGALDEHALFLGTWERQRLSWYTQADLDRPCTDRRQSEVFVVNESGITQPVRDPQLAFSGAVSHLTVHEPESLVAWIVSCGNQLELYAGSLDPTGSIVDLRLLWFGEGVVDGALLLWDGQSLNLNTVAPGGDPFFAEFDLENDRAFGTGAIDVSGGPDGLAAFPLAASTDGSYSYWATAVPEAVSRCNGQAYGLWLRDATNRWMPALIDDTIAVLDVSALALEQDFSQVAFADACDRVDGRLFVGTQRADGLLTGLREVDLSPFVPGHADQLFWFEPTTLRVETDNQGFGFGQKRFDYRLNEGRDTGIMVQLD